MNRSERSATEFISSAMHAAGAALIPEPSVAGLPPQVVADVRSGLADGLPRALVLVAANWFARGGSDIRSRQHVSLSDLVSSPPGLRVQTTAEQRAFLAAACDLYDVLAQSGVGRKALLDLYFEPVEQERKRE